MVVLLLALMAQAPGSAVVSVARGEFSGVSEARQVVARTPAEWDAVWKAHAPGQTAPAVNLSTEMVAAIFLGTRPTGGYRVEITATRQDGDTLVIEYTERQPGAGDIVTQVQTSPFHLARVPRHAGPVRFLKQSNSGRTQ